MFSHWYFTGGGPLTAGIWYHVVAVLDRSANKAKLYVDGVGYECPWEVPADAFIFEGRCDLYMLGGTGTTYDDVRIIPKR